MLPLLLYLDPLLLSFASRWATVWCVCPSHVHSESLADRWVVVFCSPYCGWDSRIASHRIALYVPCQADGDTGVATVSKLSKS